MIFGKKRHFDIRYLPSVDYHGYFMNQKDNECYGWFYCRENFQDIGKMKILFQHPANKGANIASLIRDVEKMIKIRPFTQCGPTQSPRVSWINASSWWYRTKMRKSFFTMMLRAGQFYNMDHKRSGIEKAFFEQEYGQFTQNAICRFLDGHVRFSPMHGRYYRANDSIQWADIFWNCSKKDAERMLK